VSSPFGLQISPKKVLAPPKRQGCHEPRGVSEVNNTGASSARRLASSGGGGMKTWDFQTVVDTPVEEWRPFNQFSRFKDEHLGMIDGLPSCCLRSKDWH
jgi:hypothetical protein